MHVHCSNCDKPWDIAYLWHDAIFETGLAVYEAEAWRTLSCCEKLTKRYRDEFRAAGFEFGETLIDVIKCSCCRKDAKLNQEFVQAKSKNSSPTM
jgi:hypothetical protein